MSCNNIETVCEAYDGKSYTRMVLSLQEQSNTGFASESCMPQRVSKPWRKDNIVKWERGHLQKHNAHCLSKKNQRNWYKSNNKSLEFDRQSNQASFFCSIYNLLKLPKQSRKFECNSLEFQSCHHNYFLSEIYNMMLEYGIKLKKSVNCWGTNLHN